MSTAPLSKRHQIVDGKRIAFHERGNGDAIVFLHAKLERLLQSLPAQVADVEQHAFLGHRRDRAA
jgi:hypothetical protein